MKRLIIICILLVTICHFTIAQITYTSDTTYYVTVTYNGDSASAVITNDIKDYISVTINGGDVTITSTATAAQNEITYGLYGSTNDGSFTLIGTYKATIELFGVSITNPTGPAIDIQNGKRIEVSAKKETVSTLVDGTSTVVDAWKGAFQCKGHTEFKGKGTLNVYGNYAHAIWSKEYIEVKNCTINVYSAVKDAINCNQYFLMESGEINLSGFGDDGIQVSLKTDDTSVENTGNFTMTGGTINITMGAAAGQSVKIDGVSSIATTASLNVAQAQGIEDVENDQPSCVNYQKMIENGQVFILRDNKIYTILGHEQ